MAKFSSRILRHKRQFHSLTGVEPDMFQIMIERLRPHWRERIVTPKDRSGRPWAVGDLEDHLLVLLILYRCAIIQDFLACLYQTDQAAISRSLRRMEPLAKHVLGVKRSIRVSREEAEALIIDCTEQPIQRPSRKQRCWYSGKKKRHTIKTEIIVTEQGKIVSVSKSAPGRVHDIEIRRRSAPLPKDAHAYTDSGYQGLQKDHPNTEMPYKKSKKHPLTKDERAYNHALSRFRVRVEHRIAKLKSFRILSERYRYPKATYAVSIGVIATPAAAAQDVCDRLLAAGVTSILNFAPVVLNVPSGVDVRKVDLSIELQILAFHAQRRAIVGMTQEREWQERRARRDGDREPDASAALALGGESGVEAQAVGT